MIPAINSIQPNKHSTRKTTQQVLIRNNTIDGVTSSEYKKYLTIVHTYNNKGVTIIEELRSIYLGTGVKFIG